MGEVVARQDEPETVRLSFKIPTSRRPQFLKAYQRYLA
jgi:hypothetical protein